MAYRVSKEINSPVVKVTTSGEIDADEINSIIFDIERACLTYNTQFVIVDQSKSSAQKISGDEILGIAQMTAKLNKSLAGGRLAVILVSELDYGLGRMWEAYISGKLSFESELFRNLNSAEQWIDEALHAGKL